MRRSFSRRGGHCLLPFMHRAGLFGELRLSSWMVLSLLWPLSIPIYYFPLCQWCFQPVLEDSSRKSSCQCIQGHVFVTHCYSPDIFMGWWWKWRSPTQWISFPFCCSAGCALEQGSWASQVSQLAGSQPGPWTQHRGRPWTRRGWHSSAEGIGPFAQCVCYQVKGQELPAEKHRECW